MPFMQTGATRLYYQIEGREDAPWLVLSNSLGTELAMWEPQMAALLERFRVLRHDTRGHGRSGVSPGPYSIEQLGQDVIALMDHAGIASAHFCGLSMGGMIGMWLGANRPERIRRLVLCNTAAKIGTPEIWNQRIDTVRREGMAAIAPAVLERWFTPGFRARAPEQVEPVRAMLLRTPPEGYIANCAAVRDMDQREGLSGIRAPTLVIAGTHDSSTPAADGRLVAQKIAGARYGELDAAHLSNIEQSTAFTETVAGFMQEGAGHG
jgi:3-oxoadipate enol-lactonase